METRFYTRASQSFRHSLFHPQTSHHHHQTLAGRNPDLTYRRRIPIIPRRISVRLKSTQARPLGGFYESILLESPSSPSPPRSDPAAAKLQPTTSSTSEKSAAAAAAAQKGEVAADKARVVFGSRLAGPAERRLVKERESQIVAGVRVPPRPAEPDNCCMSGCVNCVWDVYRDDMEEWAMMRKKADRAAAAAAKKRKLVRVGVGKEEVSIHTLVSSMDDDGGGSETNWGGDGDLVEMDGADDANDALFSEIPVGIREFMKQEKRLKEKHLREGTSGG